MEKDRFYQIYDHADHLVAGDKVSIEHRIEYKSWNSDTSELLVFLTLSPEELEAKREASAALEGEIYQELQSVAKKWEVQAAQTLLMDKALEYVKTPEVKHTSNEWAEQKDGIWEISNRVYKMRYKISRETKDSKKGQWLVTWGIAINRPPRPATERFPYTGDTMVVEQKKKYYNAEADAQHYIQGRFDVYAHLFTELSPPIPYEYRRHFRINGVLLPGYSVAPLERAPQEVADELLALLEDSDIARPSERNPPLPEQAAAPPTSEKTSDNPLQMPVRRIAERPGCHKKARPARVR